MLKLRRNIKYELIGINEDICNTMVLNVPIYKIKQQINKDLAYWSSLGICVKSINLV